MATQSSMILQLGTLIAGLQKHQANETLIIDGITYTTAQLVALLQALIDALNASAAARAAYRQTVAKSDALLAADRATVGALKNSVYVMYGNSASVLADYGLPPRTRKALTAAEKAARAVKAEATRKARHTMGKRQKASVTGETVAAAASAEAPASPAPTVGPVVTGTASAK